MGRVFVGQRAPWNPSVAGVGLSRRQSPCVSFPPSVLGRLVTLEHLTEHSLSGFQCRAPVGAAGRFPLQAVWSLLLLLQQESFSLW